ncbi:Cro/Cl family transcriptional regulator [Lactobacillus paraplantarum] [Lactiplantibacillus mudanjiangensis]|uniref:helix-turn-helix domain-containing protein n=1 Tax=Lactiplantibacillus mudanjiangensis TaxID=1296538 RepID=UPI0010158291|nr:Cro/Cl family transcriptional regulator [Lactobacillus paraplantarum] [Lactiplantibacillus mudanjiangensis]
MRLQDLLKQQRLQNHYTQAQLAEKLFVSTQAVSKWEHGQSVPTIDNLLMLSDLYNLSLDELVQGSPFFKKPYIVGHQYRRSRVIILLIGWLVVSILACGLNLQVGLVFVMIPVLTTGCLLLGMTKDYWIIEQYGRGFILPKLLAKDQHLQHIRYADLTQVTLNYQVYYHISAFDFGPDSFKLGLTAKDGRQWTLDFSTRVKDFLPQFVNYLERQGVPVNDDQQIMAVVLRGESLYDHFNESSNTTKAN